MRCLALLGLLVTLAACLDEGEGRPGIPRDPLPKDGRLRVRVLDPGGRLFQHREAARILLRDPAGTIRRAPSFDGVREGSTLAVIATGCEVYEAPAKTSGLQIVHLKRGIPIRVRLVGLEALPEGLTEFGIGLKRSPPAHAWWADEVDLLRAVWAGWMDEDRPTKQEWTRVRPPDVEVPLYVPMPGSYVISWHAGWASHGWGSTTRDVIEVGYAAGEVFDVAAPLETLEDLGASARGEKPR